MSEYDSDSEYSTGGGATRKPTSAGPSSSLVPAVSAAGAAAAVTPRWSAMVAATRDKQTDSDIFALGEAASRLDDLDDVLAGFGTDFSELFNADGGSITTTTCRMGPPSPSGPIGRRRGEALLTTTVGDANDPYSTIQVGWFISQCCFLFVVLFPLVNGYIIPQTRANLVVLCRRFDHL